MVIDKILSETDLDHLIKDIQELITSLRNANDNIQIRLIKKKLGVLEIILKDHINNTRKLRYQLLK
jgi:hypothetical protein